MKKCMLLVLLFTSTILFSQEVKYGSGTMWAGVINIETQELNKALEKTGEILSVSKTSDKYVITYKDSNVSTFTKIKSKKGSYVNEKGEIYKIEDILEDRGYLNIINGSPLSKEDKRKYKISIVFLQK